MEALPAATDPILPAKGSSDSDDAETDADNKDQRPDPLADAIATGATAVLALGPTIVAVPVQAPVETQIKIDAPIEPLPAAKLSALAGRHPGTRFNTVVQMPSSTEAEPRTMAEAIGLLTDVPAEPSPEQTESGAPKPQAAAAETKPTTVELSPEITEAVITTLKRSEARKTEPSEAPPIAVGPLGQDAAKAVTATLVRDDEAIPSTTPPTGTAPLRRAPAEARSPEAARAEATPVTASARLHDNAPPAVATQADDHDADPSIASFETAPAIVPTPIPAAKKADAAYPAAPVPESQEQQQIGRVQQTNHSRADGPSPTRRADTRRRIETAAGQPAGPAPRTAEPIAQPPTAQHADGPVQAKGDTVVEQTLTIARDGAWLDRLAHDIARSASNDGH